MIWNSVLRFSLTYSINKSLYTFSTRHQYAWVELRRENCIRRIVQIVCCLSLRFTLLPAIVTWTPFALSSLIAYLRFARFKYTNNFAFQRAFILYRVCSQHTTVFQCRCQERKRSVRRTNCFVTWCSAWFGWTIIQKVKNQGHYLKAFDSIPNARGVQWPYVIQDNLFRTVFDIERAP